MKITSGDKTDTIFRNEKDGKVTYSIGISTKDEEGKYVNAYIPVRFKKGVEPTERMTKVRIFDAFPTFSKFKDKDGNDVVYKYIMIMDYSDLNENNEFNKTTSIKADDIELSEDDFPF